MQITIEWKNGLIEIVSTSGGETGLSSDVNAQGRPNGRAMATMARVRFDLFESEGLRIDFWWYSTIRDGSTALTKMDEGDIGAGLDIPNLNLEPGRILRLLDRDQLDDVASISVDGKWRIRRYDDMLVNETLFENQCLYWLGKKASALPVTKRVTLLHEKIRQAHCGWSKAEVAESFGFPVSVWERIAADEACSAIDGEAVDVRSIVSAARRDNPGATKADLFASINSDRELVSWDDFAEVWDFIDAD